MRQAPPYRGKSNEDIVRQAFINGLVSALESLPGVDEQHLEGDEFRDVELLQPSLQHGVVDPASVAGAGAGRVVYGLATGGIGGPVLESVCETGLRTRKRHLERTRGWNRQGRGRKSGKDMELMRFTAPPQATLLGIVLVPAFGLLGAVAGSWPVISLVAALNYGGWGVWPTFREKWCLPQIPNWFGRELGHYRQRGLDARHRRHGLWGLRSVSACGTTWSSSDSAG